MEGVGADPLRHGAALPDGGAALPDGVAAVGAPATAVPLRVISDSGSSTEVDEDDEAGGGAGAQVAFPLGLLSTWAFSQGRTGRRGAATQSSSSPAHRVRRERFSGRTATAAPPSRGFSDFALRAPAGAEPPPGGARAGDSDEEERAEAAPDAPAPPPPRGSDRNALAVGQEGGGEEEVEERDGDDGPSDARPPAAPASQSQEGEPDTCSICFEAWTVAGEHRVAALRCGHLYGLTCILRWLASQGSAAKCPQCNKKAKRSDVVPLYAPKLRAVDNSQHESLKRSLEEEQSLRRAAELESAHCKLRLQVITSKYSQAQRELQELRAQALQGGGSSAADASSSSRPPPQGFPSSQLPAPYGFHEAVLVSNNGGCRVLAHCQRLNCLLASKPSAHDTLLLASWGVKKMSLAQLRSSQYVPIHQGQIRAMCFNGQGDGMLLSASLDKTLKLTSLPTNAVVQSYNTGKPVWSCCWCLDNPNYFYAGLSNGSILLYDIRDTSTHVQELQPLHSRAPVVSLCYIPRAASDSFPCGGLIAGTLEAGGFFWERLDDSAYKSHVLPLEVGSCTDIQVETESRHCLVTYRAGRFHPTVRCVLMALTREPQRDAGSPACSCTPVQTFNAGSSCSLLNKNAIFAGPHGGGALVCAGDEATQSAVVWEASSGALLQRLPADLIVVDISPFAVNGEHFLASLTEKMVKLYKWK